MKIANVMLARGLGGIEQAIIDYSEALRLAGHEVCAIIHPDAAIKNTLQKSNITCFTLSNFGAWDPFAARRLRKLLKEQNIDVCIAHGNRGLSLLKLAADGQKLIAVTHNYKIKCKGVTSVFCPTKDLMQHAEKQHVAKENIFYIPNMVRAFPDITSRHGGKRKVIGSMGRFVDKKGFDIFVKSLAIRKDRNIAFRAVLAGDGEEADALKALTSAKGLNDVLSFPGWVENKKDFFGNIDIFCLPSHHEPFGIVLLEAMAYGLPVVSTSSEGPSEILTDHINGILVEKSDPVAMADALQNLLEDEQTASILARNASENVKNNYDLPVVSRKLALALGSLEPL